MSMLMALSWSFPLLINNQTQHTEPPSQIQACSSILWAVPEMRLHLGKKNRMTVLEVGGVGSLDRGSPSGILLL